MNAQFDRSVLFRSLVLSLVLVCLSLLGACTDIGAERPESRQVAEACRGVLDVSPRNFERSGAGAATADSHASAHWYVGGRVTSADLEHFYRHINYELIGIRLGVAEVPRVIVAQVPEDLAALDSIDRRKAVFVSTLLPLALQINASLRDTRLRLHQVTKCLRAGGELPKKARAWLAGLHEHYRTDGDFGRLMRRVDVVPASLLIAQAAIESAWGTSRFAVEGNALFGERTYSRSAGMKPAAAERLFYVRRFDTLFGAVDSYIHNLNVSDAYSAFRTRRAEARREEPRPLDGAALAGTLDRYSERGADYVDDLCTIIEVNDLEAFDAVHLRGVAEDGIPGEPVRVWTMAATN